MFYRAGRAGTLVTLCAVALLSTGAHAQSVIQAGPSVGGHAPMYVIGPGGGFASVQDSGFASGLAANGSASGTGVGEFLQISRAPGTGPFGSHVCFYDAPVTSAAGSHYFCIDANAAGGPLLASGSIGAAAPLPLHFSVNGTLYQFPFLVGGILGPPSTVVGDCAVWNNTNGTLLADHPCAVPPVSATIVPTNAALVALAVPPLVSQIRRGGFYANGDGGAATYNYSVSACSLNSGNGDNGSQVKPTAGGGCWLADFSGSQPSPLVWGATGDGSTDDTTAVQAAINASQGASLWLGTKSYSVNGLTSGKISLIGEQSSIGGIYNRTCASGLFARTTSETLLMLNSGTTGALIDGVCIQMNAAPNVQSAGAAISLGVGSSNIVRGGQINYPFIGIDISGMGGTQNVQTHIENEVITDPTDGGGIGIRLGTNSIGESTVDTFISGTTIDCINFGTALPTTSTIGMLLLDAGGSFITNNDIYGCGVGTKLFPSTGQSAANLFFTNTVLGDTSGVNDLMIDTAGSGGGGIGIGVVFTNTWTASAVGTSALIKNSASRSLIGVHFIGHRFFPAANQIALDIQQGLEITVSGSMICGRGTSSTLVNVADDGQLDSFTDNEIGECEGLSGTPTVGITIDANANAFRIQNNTFFNVATPIVWPSLAASTALIDNNLGLDNGQPTVASATSINLPFGNTVLISGTTPIQTMTGMWSNRKITLVALGVLPFITGGNVCDAITTLAGQQVQALWIVSLSCWRVDIP